MIPHIFSRIQTQTATEIMDSLPAIEQHHDRNPAPETDTVSINDTYLNSDVYTKNIEIHFLRISSIEASRSIPNYQTR